LVFELAKRQVSPLPSESAAYRALVRAQMIGLLRTYRGDSRHAADLIGRILANHDQSAVTTHHLGLLVDSVEDLNGVLKRDWRDA